MSPAALHVIGGREPDAKESASGNTEQRLKAIVESAPMSLMIVDANGKVIAANRAALKMRGAERLPQLVGRNVCDTVAPQDRERFAQFVGEVCSGSSGTLEHDLQTLEGSQCPVETHAVPLQRDAGSPPVFLGITVDVSERRRLESALRRAEAKLEALEAQRLRRTPPAAPASRVEAQERHQAMIERDRLIASLREADRQASAMEPVDNGAATSQKSMMKRIWRKGR